MILTLASLISSIMFILSTAMALVFVFTGYLEGSITYALLAAWWFILMVIFGYVYVNRSY